MRYLYYQDVVNRMRIQQPDGSVSERDIKSKISSDHRAFCHASFFVQTPKDQVRYENKEVDYCFKILLCDGTTFEVPMTIERINEVKDSLAIPEAIEFLKSIPLDETFNSDTHRA